MPKRQPPNLRREPARVESEAPQATEVPAFDSPAAGPNRGLVECADFTHAADSEDEAVVGQRYDQFRRDKLVETYTTWARRLRDEGKLADSIKVYRDLLSVDESFAAEVAGAYLRLAKKLISEPPVSASAAATALLAAGKP